MRSWDRSTSTQGVELVDLSGTQPASHVLVSAPVDAIAASLSEDGSQAATVDQNGTIHLWELHPAPPSPRALTLDARQLGTIRAMRFHPDGRHLLAYGDDRSAVASWDLTTGEVVYQELTPGPEWTSRVALSADGRWFVRAFENSVQVRELETRRDQTWSLSRINGIAFHPKGHEVALGGWDQVSFRDLSSGQETAPPLLTRAGWVAYGAGGAMLATFNAGDDTLRLWDTASGFPLGHIGDSVARVVVAAFIPGRKAITVGFSSGRVSYWDLDLAAWRDAACRIARRNLSCAEWTRYIGSEEYHATCPELPSGCG